MGSVDGGPWMGEVGLEGTFIKKRPSLETPAAQGPAQGPRKVQGAEGRQGGIQAENSSAVFVYL